MKRVTVLLFGMIFSAFVFSASAQEDKDLTTSEKSKYGDNWFISLGGNANLLSGEQDKDQSVTDRLKYGGAITVGKWFNSTFGMRFQIVGGALRGFNYVISHGGEYLDKGDGRWLFPLGFGAENTSIEKGFATNFDEIREEGDWIRNGFKVVRDRGEAVGFWQDFNYSVASIDLMTNLTNLFRGYYKEGNLIDIIPFAGVGYIRAYDNSSTTPDFYFVTAKLGVRANFNLSPKWAIYLEPQTNITSPEFDGYKGDAMGDVVSNLSFGIQYTFNRNFASTASVLSLDEINYLNDKINENRRLIDGHRDILDRQQDSLDRLEKCCDGKEEQVTTQVIEKGTLPEYVRFTLDSYEIDQSEYTKIVEVVKYLKTVSGSKILLVGYADKNTGNSSYNLNLSQKRVEAVSNELVRLGLNPNRVSVEWKGDKVQPFAPNDWNRVVVMVERK
jgi:outer membrane protein OmpA-like peptidoglycan-associated protein